MKKNFFFLVAILFVVALGFQNCGGNFESTGSGTSSGSSLTGSNMPPTGPNPSPNPTPNPNPSQDQINRQRCAANFNNPNLATISPTEVTVNSGLGARSGDSNPMPSFTATGNMSLIDPAVQTSSNCAMYTQFSLQCDIIVDAAHPATITKAITLAGENVAGNATTDTAKRELLGRVMNLNNCDNRDMASGTANGRIELNRGDNHVRCVQGSFYLRLRSQQDTSGTSKTSTAQYMKVNLSDNCWAETRLKMNGNQTFPARAQTGASTAIDGNWAAVISPMQNMGAVVDVGAVHIYNFDGTKWNFHSTLQPTGAAGGDTLNMVALKGDTLIISSAYRKDQGEVLVYKLAGNSWNFSQAISPQTSQVGQGFGTGLSFDGTRLAVGAPNFSRTAGDRAGVVYVYTISGGNFVHQQTLSVPEAEFANKGFGMSVSISGTTLAVGAPMAITKESLGRGDVRIFQLNGATWSQSAVKAPPAGLSASNGLRFGASVALSGTKLLVGAPGHKTNDNTNAGGAVYYANFSGNQDKVWTSNTKDGKYGTSVALGTNGLFIGAPFTDARGSVEYFTYGSFQNPTYVIFATNSPGNSDGFGSSVAVSGTRVIAGARSMSDPETYSGAAYIFQMK